MRKTQIKKGEDSVEDEEGEPLNVTNVEKQIQLVREGTTSKNRVRRIATNRKVYILTLWLRPVFQTYSTTRNVYRIQS